MILGIDDGRELLPHARYHELMASGTTISLRCGQRRRIHHPLFAPAHWVAVSWSESLRWSERVYLLLLARGGRGWDVRGDLTHMAQALPRAHKDRQRLWLRGAGSRLGRYWKLVFTIN